MSEAKTAEGELRSSADISWEMKGFERIWKRQMRSARLIGKVCQKCGRCVFVFPTELLGEERNTTGVDFSLIFVNKVTQSE